MIIHFQFNHHTLPAVTPFKTEANLLSEVCLDLICESCGELVEWRVENGGEGGLVE